MNEYSTLYQYKPGEKVLVIQPSTTMPYTPSPGIIGLVGREFTICRDFRTEAGVHYLFEEAPEACMLQGVNCRGVHELMLIPASSNADPIELDADALKEVIL